jgi:phosphopantetheinyl transferase
MKERNLTAGVPATPGVWQVSFPGTGRLLVYASRTAARGAKEALARLLLTALSPLAPAWAEAFTWGPLRLSAGPLGQPLLFLGPRPGPPISFSHAGDSLWGALAAAGHVGIDAALETEFAPPYPFHRAFCRSEWEWALSCCQGREPAAAALLWAAKEAAVKARGTGFHTIDPLAVTVSPPSPAHDGLLLTVHTPEPLPAWARPLPGGWLALAAA